MFPPIFLVLAWTFRYYGKQLLLLFLQRALNITIPTNTQILLLKAINNWKQLLIRLQLQVNNVLRYLVNKINKSEDNEIFFQQWEFCMK